MNKNKLKIFAVIIPFIATGLIALLKLRTAFFISLLPFVILLYYVKICEFGGEWFNE